MFLQKEGDVEDLDLYILLNGHVKLSLSYSERGENSQEQTISSVKLMTPFGENSFFTGSPRKTTARSINYSSAYVLRRDDFIECLRKFPLDYVRKNLLFGLKQTCMHMCSVGKINLFDRLLAG